MTNEELAIQIQQGNTDLYGELWENIKGLIAKLCFRYESLYKDLCISSGITFDDLMQSGYIAMVKAVKDFKIEKEYKFTTYLNLHFKSIFLSMCGYRSSKRDAFLNCLRLDAPLDAEGDTTIGDTVQDKSNDIEQSEERIYREQLSQTVKECLADLPDEQRAVLIGRYYDGLSLADVGLIQGCTKDKARTIEANALRQLRRAKYFKRLKEYADDIFSHSLRSTGLNSFQNKCASSVELTVEWLNRDTPPNPCTVKNIEINDTDDSPL